MFPPPYRPQMFGRYPPRKHPNLRYGHNTYESPDYRSQRNHSGRSNQKSQQGPTTDVSKGQLAELTSQLYNLVAQLANLPKDAPERDEVNREITIVKAKMKKVKTEPASSAGNMNRKLLFNDLPESAKGPGNLAAWIAGKAAILQPKQIAMLATTAAGAVIEYKSLSVAEEVLRSCKKHQIAACWAPSEITQDVSKEGDHVDTEMHTDVDYNLL
ncbi:ADP-glyceromanno-heptose 6-epimerase, putative [Babesia ovis]|uniref:ADP-glyceromanno-heptose 6-epimerase, putative n=1 Tax=Babesia ovis TaxID=5869 RepID=A0A9W5T9M0_BABOV|nr:ADP-glyceromanno-heptose 6-epimerase, putative [Babesia ovis]